MYLIITVFFIFPLLTLSQDKSFNVSGILLDSTSSQPLSYGNIQLENLLTNKKQFKESNSTGNFQFDGLSKGVYSLIISYVGYSSKKIEFTISDKNILLNEVYLNQEAVFLNEATVKALKPKILQEPGKVVVNVEGTVLANSGTVIEVLKHSPFVKLDEKMNLTLQGKNATILLDGKPIYIAGDDLESFLAGIISTNIDKLELISNPGAKYEASNLAVINIKTIKNKGFGITGTLTNSLALGIYPRFSNGIQLFSRKERINIFGGVTHQYLKRLTKTDNIRNLNNLENKSSLYFNDLENDIRTNNLLNLKIGADINLTSTTVLSMLFQSDLNSRDRSVTYFSKIGQTENIVDSILNLTSFGKAKYINRLGSINITKVFPKHKNELSVDFDFGKYSTDWTEESRNTSYNFDNTNIKEYAVETPWDRLSDFQAYKLLYKFPLKTGKLEVGLQHRSTHIETNFELSKKLDDDWITDVNLLSRFNYHENVSAAYFNFDRKKSEKIYYNLGIRAEKTQVNSLEKTDGSSQNSTYIKFFPSFMLQFSPTQKVQYSLNYSKRIIRPSYDWQNSKLLYKNLFFYSRGSRTLQPAISNSLEVTANINQLLNIKIGYVSTKNTLGILPIKEGNKTIYQVGNFPKLDVFSANFSYNKQLTKNILTSTGVQYSYTNTSLNLGSLKANFGNSISFYSQNYFNLGAIGKLDISANYSSKLYDDSFTIMPIYYIDLGLSKSIFNKKLDMRLAIFDIFNTNTPRGFLQNESIYLKEKYKVETRFVRINFTYRFGNNNVKTKEKKSAIEQELKRLN